MYIANLRRFINYFGKGRKLKLLVFFLMSFIAGVFEFLGIALIYPFVKFMICPDEMLHFVNFEKYSFLSGMSGMHIALLLGLLVLLLFSLKNLYMIGFLYVQCKFLQKWTRHINNMFVSFYLHSPYKNIMKISNAEKIYAITTLSGHATNSYLMSVMNFVTNTFIVAVVLALILFKFPVAGVSAFVFALTCILLQNFLFKKKVGDLGRKLQETSRKMNRINYTTVNSIKDIKIMNCEVQFYDDFCNMGSVYSDQNAMHVFWGGIPPYLVETIVVLTFLVMAYFIEGQKNGDATSVIASFALLAGSIFRIAPAINRIQSALLRLPVNLNFVQELNNVYEKFGLAGFKYESLKKHGRMPFYKKIFLNNICFSYEEGKTVLENVSLQIDKNDFIGIIGLSGAGKSTLADVLTGILLPDSGEMVCDDTVLTQENISGFRKNIGYVPQELNILEKSFRENVAWGVPESEIDDEKVEFLLNQVHLGDLVAGYENGIYSVPFVGENGLSRGQKQRLAIARALYRDPDILIFDEATSALDVKIESEITDMLLNICKNKTIVAIAHRLSTLKACNKLVYLKDGELLGVGTFKDLSERFPEFAELIRLSSLN